MSKSAFESLQVGRHYNSSGQHRSVCGRRCVFQPVPISPFSHTGCSRKEPGSALPAPSLQESIDIGKIPPDPSFLRAEQSQHCLPFLIKEILQPLKHLINRSNEECTL